MKLTNASIEDFACPTGKADVTFFCSELPGFGLRVRSSGVKRWVVQFEVHGKTRRVTIGDPRLFNAEEARRIARQILAKAKLGQDPAQEKVAARLAAKLTLGAVAERYLADREGKLRPASMKHAQRHLRVWWKPLHGKPLGAITRKDIAALLDGPPVAASRARATLMALYSWAIKRGEIEVNPVIGTAIPDEHVKPRERVLTETELVKIWRACNDDAYGRIIRLLILCGSRRAEVGDLKWNELYPDEGVWRLPPERSKSGRGLVLPLASEAWAILGTVPRWRDGDFLFGRRAGFQGWAPNKRRLDERSGVTGWRHHDLRRSVATHMNDIGVQPHIVEAVLGHTTFRRGVAAVYNRASYQPQVKAALAQWADRIAALVEGREQKVIPLR
jgi:integrase